MKLLKRVTVTSLLIVSLIFTSIPISAATVINTRTNQPLSTESINRVCDVFLNEIQVLPYKKLSISTKYLTDLSGDKYILGECQPIGYFIYHINSGNLVEYSLTSYSPYLNLSGELIYLGPTQYYTVEDQRLVHTITDEKVSSDLLNTMMSTKKLMSAALMENKVEENINYVLQKSEKTINSLEKVQTGNKYIADYDCIRNLTTDEDMGYATQGDGLCGYVAASITLLYYDNTSNRDFIDDYTFLITSGGYKKFYNGSFTMYLRTTYGDKDATTAFSIDNVIIDYCASRGISLQVYSTLLPRTSTMKGHIDNNNPVILFGNLYSPKHNKNVNHAVTVYGYTTNSKFIAHYGWEDYYNIYVSSDLPWGSAFAIKGF